MKGWVISMIAVTLLLTVSTSVAASCHGRFANPITDVCWGCLFPITIGSANLIDGDNPDTPNTSFPVCLCPGVPPRVGISVGFWEPINLVDVTRHPFCLVNLGGMQLNFGDYVGEGEVDTANGMNNTSFYYVHWYVFPLMYWLNLLSDGLCVQQGDFDIAYLAELDPTWRDDELSFIINPEAVVFANPVAQAACAADAISADSGLAQDALFWCAGSQGSMYPLTGHVQEHVGGVQASVLLSERMDFKMHRQGLLKDSKGTGGSDMCYETITPILPKSRYRYQMTYPIPAASFPNGCKPFGRSTAIWGAGREYPYKGEDFGYLIWRKRNCCSF